MHRIYTFIGLLFLASLSISGCYTTVSSKKLTKQAWIRNHRYQFFSDSKWGKEWNDYYWNPNIKKNPKSKKDINEEKVIHDRDIYEAKSRERYYHDDSNCVGNCIFIFLDNLFSNDDDDSGSSSSSSDSTDNTPSQPQPRRGM
ncbi:hypothetical protein J7L68_07730 [bacterium]|nr:hypothetical protein [bacterium]